MDKKTENNLTCSWGLYDSLRRKYGALEEAAKVLQIAAIDLSNRYDFQKVVLMFSIGCNVALVFIIYLISF